MCDEYTMQNININWVLPKSGFSLSLYPKKSGCAQMEVLKQKSIISISHTDVIKAARRDNGMGVQKWPRQNQGVVFRFMLLIYQPRLQRPHAWDSVIDRLWLRAVALFSGATSSWLRAVAVSAPGQAKLPEHRDSRFDRNVTCWRQPGSGY